MYYDVLCLLENPPGEDVFTGIGIRKCAKLSDDHALLCDGSYISVRFDKPRCTVDVVVRRNMFSHLFSLISINSGVLL